MKKQIKNFSVKSIDLQDDGSFECYGSVFNHEDYASEVVLMGAFAESIKHHHEIGTAPLFLWDHRHDVILGRWTSFEEDEIGLRLKGQFNLETDDGLLRYKQLKARDLNGFSIGYSYSIEDAEVKDGITYLSKLDLMEVSLVPFPCNDLSQLLSIKSINTKDDLTVLIKSIVTEVLNEKALLEIDNEDDDKDPESTDVNTNSDVEIEVNTNETDEEVSELLKEALSKLQALAKR
ncbi:TPA: HK97 family phage prohead protease [Aeromonas hydrophila]|uniref:HK97 family phage prohead protease n=1 Tax=Aeromonas hydrophila TaxID=644 RepID=A0AAD3YKR1_AERHY|nr:HK97 family phage prohead protease [Aeromonas hydrophila]